MKKLAVTFAEAAQMLSVSESIINRMVTNGELPIVQFEGAKRISVADLEHFLLKFKKSAQQRKLKNIDVANRGVARKDFPRESSISTSRKLTLMNFMRIWQS
jgi:excisionase family DNA binding protein